MLQSAWAKPYKIIEKLQLLCNIHWSIYQHYLEIFILHKRLYRFTFFLLQFCNLFLWSYSKNCNTTIKHKSYLIGSFTWRRHTFQACKQIQIIYYLWNTLKHWTLENREGSYVKVVKSYCAERWGKIIPVNLSKTHYRSRTWNRVCFQHFQEVL